MKIKESSLYEPVQRWLMTRLKEKFKRQRADVYTFDSHKTNLSTLIQQQGLQNHFPQFSAWDIKVDITGIIIKPKSADLVFMECKTGPVTWLNVGQLLGYSRVANPLYSFLVSPEPPSDKLSILLETFGRYDILEYGKSRTIRILRWDIGREEVCLSDVFPPGKLF